MEVICPGAKPSREIHAVCAYWLMSKAVFNADASVPHRRTMPSAIMRRAIPACSSVSPRFMMSFSEQVPYGELNLSRRAETFGPSEGGEEPSEGARRQEVCVGRRGQLQPVDDVVDLDSHLRFLTASQRYVFEKRSVDLKEMGTPLCVAFKRAESAGSWIRERGGVEPRGWSVNHTDVIDAAHDVGTLIRRPSRGRLGHSAKGHRVRKAAASKQNAVDLPTADQVIDGTTSVAPA